MVWWSFRMGNVLAAARCFEKTLIGKQMLKKRELLPGCKHPESTLFLFHMAQGVPYHSRWSSGLTLLCLPNSLFFLSFFSFWNNENRQIRISNQTRLSLLFSLSSLLKEPEKPLFTAFSQCAGNAEDGKRLSFCKASEIKKASCHGRSAAQGLTYYIQFFFSSIYLTRRSTKVSFWGSGRV